MFLEYTKNLIYLCKNCFYVDVIGEILNQEWMFLEENVDFIIGYLNYEAKEFADEEIVLLVEKNPATTAVSEIVKNEVAFSVIEYNHFLLKNNIKRKKQILLSLAAEFETLRSDMKNSNKQLCSDIGYLLNKMNIRHNNIDGENAIEHVKNMNADELEEWYDEIYQMLLLAILEHENIERSKRVKRLKENIDGR